jgi:hypothetical protein
MEMTDYRKMWTELGLNLELHNQLLENLNRSHQRTHLSQKNRPETMKKFDEAFHAAHAGL